jgi:hypothetical protein
MTFNDLGVNPPYEVVADDLLAVHLLDITWRPEVVRVLLVNYKQELSAMLSNLPPEVDLWNASDPVLRHIDTIWDALTAIEGIGTASTTKLLARKRPRLCPIGDSLIKRAVDVPGRTWDVLRFLLQDPQARAEVEALRPPEAAGASLLRIVDVAIWVTHSKGAAAQLVREKCGMPPVQLCPEWRYRSARTIMPVPVLMPRSEQPSCPEALSPVRARIPFGLVSVTFRIREGYRAMPRSTIRDAATLLDHTGNSPGS